MGEGAVGIANLVDIEKNGSRNMGAVIIGMGVAATIGQMPGSIQNTHIGSRKMPRQPIGRDKR